MHTDIIKPSVSLQELPNIALIGHTGRMGSMLLKKWRDAGYTVNGVDCRPDVTFNGEVIAQAAVIVLAVPVSAICEVMSRIGPILAPCQLLMDITSVKILPMLIMQEFHGGPVIGSHPLFGPLPQKGELHTVLVAGHRATPELRESVEGLFTCFDSTVSWATAREHDHGVAFAQSLNFAMSTAFFSTIARHKECFPFLTPSFKRHMEAARKHLTIDRAMFCEFTTHNPCFSDAVHAYRKTLEETLSSLSLLSAEAATWYDMME